MGIVTGGKRAYHCIPPCTTGLQTIPRSSDQQFTRSANFRSTHTRIFSNFVNGVTIGIVQSRRKGKSSVGYGEETVSALMTWISVRYKRKPRVIDAQQTQGGANPGSIEVSYGRYIHLMGGHVILYLAVQVSRAKPQGKWPAGNQVHPTHSGAFRNCSEGRNDARPYTRPHKGPYRQCFNLVIVRKTRGLSQPIATRQYITYPQSLS